MLVEVWNVSIEITSFLFSVGLSRRGRRRATRMCVAVVLGTTKPVPWSLFHFLFFMPISFCNLLAANTNYPRPEINEPLSSNNFSRRLSSHLSRTRLFVFLCESLVVCVPIGELSKSIPQSESTQLLIVIDDWAGICWLLSISFCALQVVRCGQHHHFQTSVSTKISRPGNGHSDIL